MSRPVTGRKTPLSDSGTAELRSGPCKACPQDPLWIQITASVPSVAPVKRHGKSTGKAQRRAAVAGFHK